MEEQLKEFYIDIPENLKDNKEIYILNNLYNYVMNMIELEMYKLLSENNYTKNLENIKYYTNIADDYSKKINSILKYHENRIIFSSFPNVTMHRDANGNYVK